MRRVSLGGALRIKSAMDFAKRARPSASSASVVIGRSEIDARCGGGFMRTTWRRLHGAPPRPPPPLQFSFSGRLLLVVHEVAEWARLDWIGDVGDVHLPNGFSERERHHERAPPARCCIVLDDGFRGRIVLLHVDGWLDVLIGVLLALRAAGGAALRRVTPFTVAESE